MKEARAVCCAICGEPKAYGDHWFILVENQRMDRLKILAWNNALAVAPGVGLACGAAHLQQLVVHWMAMGSLEFRFAQAPPRIRAGKVLKTPRPHPLETDTTGSSPNRRTRRAA